jgi:hypothetical protein
MQSTSQSFTYLRNKVREWKAGDLLQPSGDQSWERFQEIATTQLTPIFEALWTVLEEEGIHATVRELSEETRAVGLSIDDHMIDLFFGPDPDPRVFQLIARRHTKRGDAYIRRIRYQLLDLDRVRELVEELLLRLLGPRRANGDTTVE